MTPYELSILLDVYSGRHLSVSVHTEHFVETIRTFMNNGWIRSEPGRAYGTTPKLIAFIEHVLSLPEPVQEWRMPELRALKEAA